MSKIVNNNYNMVDNVLATCSALAGYRLAKKIFLNNGCGRYALGSNSLVELGATAASACFGFWVGSKVREKSFFIRKNISTFNDQNKEEILKENIQKQAKDFQDWMNSVE